MTALRRLVTLERRIGQGESVGIRARWEFGRELLKARNGKGRLPNGYLAAVVEATGASQSEISYRLMFAERCPTEDELSTVMESFRSWWSIRTDYLPQHGRHELSTTPIPGGCYQTVVIDPPWDYSADRRRTYTERGGQTLRLPQPYPMLTTAEIAELPIFALMHDQAHLYLWTTRRYLRAAFDALQAWQVEYVATLTWAKAPRGFMLGGTFGASSEFCLFAKRGDLPALATVERDWFEWPRPRNEHSTKPAGFFKLVERVSPGPRIEVFARRQRAGWDVWGDEIPVAA